MRCPRALANLILGRDTISHRTHTRRLETSLAVSRIRSRSRILKLWEDANRWSHTGHADGDELALHTQTEQQAPLGGAVARGSSNACPGLGTLLASAPHTASTKEEMESDATSSTKDFVNSLARASGGSRWCASRIHATWTCARGSDMPSGSVRAERRARGGRSGVARAKAGAARRAPVGVE